MFYFLLYKLLPHPSSPVFYLYYFINSAETTEQIFCGLVSDLFVPVQETCSQTAAEERQLLIINKNHDQFVPNC